MRDVAGNVCRHLIIPERFAAEASGEAVLDAVVRELLPRRLIPELSEEIPSEDILGPVS